MKEQTKHGLGEKGRLGKTDYKERRTKGMTKVATMETRRFVAMVLIVAMLAAMLPMAVVAVLPGGVLASENDSITASFTLGNEAPTVDNAAIMDVNHNAEVMSLTPQTEYLLKVSVGDANKLSDLTKIEVQFFYDNNTEVIEDETNMPVADGQQDRITLTWENGTTPEWSLSAGTSTTWAIDTDNSTKPSNMELPSGDFYFDFTPGMVARHADDWDLYVTVYDGSGHVHQYFGNDYDMNWYGAVTMITSGTVTWGAVAPGVDFGGTNSALTDNISVKYVCNGAFYESVSAASTSWGGATLVESGDLLANQFALAADNDADGYDSDARVTLSATSCKIDTTGTITDEDGHAVATNKLYIKLGSPFANGTYSGTIYYHIGEQV